MLAGHFANANHPDCVWGNRLVIQGCIHERTGAGGRGLVVFGSHRVVSFQERLRVKKYMYTDGDEGNDIFSPRNYVVRVTLCSNQAVLVTAELLYPQVIRLIHVFNVRKLNMLHLYLVVHWQVIKHLAHMPVRHNKLWPGSEAPSVCVQARWQPGCCERSGSALWGCLGPAPHCSPSQPRAWVLQIAHGPVIWSQNKIHLSNLNWFFFLNLETIVKY